MGTRKNPETSLLAYRSLDPVRLSTMHRKIIDALSVIGKGNYEQIAAQCGEPEKRIWKRLNEVEKAGAIYNTGETVLTKDNCKSSVYAIGKAPGSVKKKERTMKGKTVADFSKAINQVSQSVHTVERLF